MVTATTTAVVGKLQTINDMSQNMVYLMGASFILGSLFTLFLLLVLDFVRRSKTDQNNQ